MSDLPSLRDSFPIELLNEEVVEVVVAGRWIAVKPGTYRESLGRVSFESPEGRIYTTDKERVQLKRGVPNRG